MVMATWLVEMGLVGTSGIVFVAATVGAGVVVAPGSATYGSLPVLFFIQQQVITPQITRMGAMTMPKSLPMFSSCHMCRACFERRS